MSHFNQNEDPLDDISNTRKIDSVIYGGGDRSTRFRRNRIRRAVDNTLRVELEGTKLGRITLRLFPEYAARGSEEILDYEDRALVELLTDFTRVSEKSVSPQFWQRNIAVMDATIQLLSRTSSALTLLAKA